LASRGSLARDAGVSIHPDCQRSLYVGLGAGGRGWVRGYNRASASERRSEQRFGCVLFGLMADDGLAEV
jgi:hypothetical protein